MKLNPRNARPIQYGLHAKKGLILSKITILKEWAEVQKKFVKKYKSPSVVALACLSLTAVVSSVLVIGWTLLGAVVVAEDQGDLSALVASDFQAVLVVDAVDPQLLWNEVTLDGVALRADSTLSEDESFGYEEASDARNGGNDATSAPARRLEKIPVDASPLLPSHSTLGMINPVPGASVNQGIHGNNGVDLGAPVGTVVYSAQSGVVSVSEASGWNGGYGNYIVVDHGDGTKALYAHLNANYVSAGSTVAQGAALGEIGMTGRTTGAHLHFEIHGGTNPFSRRY